MLKDSMLDQWLAADLNVLIEGPHGIGKTEQVIACMKRNNVKYIYLSASTMDPYLDFVGIPRVVEKDGKNELDFIQKSVFADGFEVIVIDELNRAPKKVMNALMELIQFKTVNGKPVSNVRAVWAMINPVDEEDTYNVERLDPAQEDRFQIKISLPSGPQETYFTKKHGELGKVAVAWYKKLDAVIKKKNVISPRRLEYAIVAHNKGIDISYVLPNSVNSKELKAEFIRAGHMDKVNKLATESNAEIEKALTGPGTGNLREAVLDEICNGKFPLGALEVFGDEEVTKSLKSPRVLSWFTTQLTKDNDKIIDICKTMSASALSAHKLQDAYIEAIGRIDKKNKMKAAATDKEVNELRKKCVDFILKRDTEETLEFLRANKTQILADTLSRQIVERFSKDKNKPEFLTAILS